MPGQIARVFALLLHQNAQMQLAGVQVDAVAEDKQQHQRDDEGDQATAGIAQYLPRFLQAQRAAGAEKPPSSIGVRLSLTVIPPHRNPAPAR